jgi:hypothetical protein
MLLAFGIARQVSISNFGLNGHNMELSLLYSLLADSRVEGKTLHDRLCPQFFLIFIHNYHNHPTTRRSMILITICAFNQLQTENTECG